MLKKTLALIALTLMLQACATEEDINNANTATTDNRGAAIENLTLALDDMPLGTLSDAETHGLLFMREEEKLAQDVYDYFFSVWGLRVFTNIASSESTHTEAVKALLDRYELSDPVLGNGAGEFSDTDLQALYDQLVYDGSASLIDALLVGAAIEEIDMIDIQTQIDLIEDNDDIVMVYESLLKGSRNHLRSFVSNLSRQGITYAPVYMDPADYDAIINSPMEQG